MKPLRILMAALLLAACLPALAGGPMEDAVWRFVREQTTGIAGRVDVVVDASDSRSRALACEAYDPYLPSGARLWGRTTVGVRCVGTTGPSAFVPVRVRVFGNAVVAARPVAPGQILAAEDLRLEETEVTQSGLLTDVAQAVGRRIAVGVSPGFPIRQELLRSQQVITQGETVRVQVAGAGFAILAEGTAVTHANDGQIVQVRMESGRTVSGTARAGRLVEMRY